MAMTATVTEKRGSCRFHSEFAVGEGLMQEGLIDVIRLITQSVALARATKAIVIALDRGRALKAQIILSA